MKSKYTLIVILIIFMICGCSPTIGKKVKEYGYNELRPPRRSVPPGTLITIEKLDPMIVDIICHQRESLGFELEDKILKSDSSTSEIARELVGELQIEADYLNNLKANAKYSSIKTINLVLSNVIILELPDDAVLDNLQFRTENCEKMRKDRLSDGYQVSMVKSVIQADVNYIVEFSIDIGAEAKMEITKGLVSELGVDLMGVTETSIKGKALYWGIRDDPFLGRFSPQDVARIENIRTEILSAERHGILEGSNQPVFILRVEATPRFLAVDPNYIDEYILQEGYIPVE